MTGAGSPSLLFLHPRTKTPSASNRTSASEAISSSASFAPPARRRSGINSLTCLQPARISGIFPARISGTGNTHSCAIAALRICRSDRGRPPNWGVKPTAGRLPPTVLQASRRHAVPAALRSFRTFSSVAAAVAPPRSRHVRPAAAYTRSVGRHAREGRFAARRRTCQRSFRLEGPRTCASLASLTARRPTTPSRSSQASRLSRHHPAGWTLGGVNVQHAVAPDANRCFTVHQEPWFPRAVRAGEPHGVGRRS